MWPAILFFAFSAPDVTAWWEKFNDPNLTRLVRKALDNNLDVRLAAQRIGEARAAAGVERSGLLPAINTGAGVNRLRGGFQQGVIRVPSNGTPSGSSFVSPFETGLGQASLDMRWELDFFGAKRNRVAAAQADIEGAEEQRRDVAVSVSAEVARVYSELQGLQQRLRIARRNAAAQKELLDLTQSRAEAGLATQLDVERQATLLAITEAAIPALEAEKSVRVHRLAVLTGERSLDVSFLEQQQESARLEAPALEAGLDSTLLLRRPDVRAAEASIRAAEARWRVARTDRFPKITLTGLLGRQSTSLSGLTLGGGNFFNLGPTLELPIFSGGRIQSNIAANDARMQQSRTQYEQEILAAFEEANNALTGYQRQQERRARLAAAVDSARRSLELADDLNKAGLNDFLAVLDTQRQLFDAEDALAQSDTLVLTQSVALFKALAGGWPR